MRALGTTLLTLAAASLLATNTQAAVTITMEETPDGDVVVSYSGTINRTALQSEGPLEPSNDTFRAIQPLDGLVSNFDFGVGTPAAYTATLSDLGDLAFGNGEGTDADSFSGDNFYVEADNDTTIIFFLDAAYNGEALSGSLTFNDTNFCALGISAGTNTAEFGVDGITDTITIERIPLVLEPNPLPPRADAAYGIRECDQALAQIDLGTGAVEFIGFTGGDDIDGLTFSPEGVLYGVDNDLNTLVTIDILTAAVTTIGSFSGAATEVGNSGLAFNSEGELYLVTSEPDSEAIILYSVNPATAALTLVGPQPDDTGFASLAFSADDTLYSVADANEDDGVDQLFTLSTTGGAPTAVGPLGVTIDLSQGLTFALDGVLYLSDEGSQSLYSVNTTTGTASLIANLGDDFEGIAAPPENVLPVDPAPPPGSSFVPRPVPVDSPWVLLLLALGMAGLAGRSLRNS